MEALLQAQDPSTTAAVLLRLASHRDARVRAGVAANPNTPDVALAWLLVRFAPSVLQNPALDFLILENPNWLADLPVFARRALLADAGVPPGFLRWALVFGNDEDKRVALGNAQVPLGALKEDDLEALGALRDLHVNGAALLNTNDDDAVLAQAVANLERDSDLLLDALAFGLPAWLLAAAANDADPQVRLAVVAQANTDEATLGRLLLDDDEDVRVATRKRAANMPNTLGQVLRLERGDLLELNDLFLLARQTWGRVLVAQHPQCQGAWLEDWAADADWRVRVAVAANAVTPSDALEVLAFDSDRDVRAALAQNLAASAQTLEKLALDESPEVRGFALQHPHMPEDFRVLLLDANRAGLPLHKIMAWSERGPWAQQLLAEHLDAPQDSLVALAQSEDWHVRAAVAGNSNAPHVVLEALLEDNDSDVRGALAGNAQCPAHLLERLLGDANFEVRRKLALNTGVFAATACAWLASDENWVVRQAVAQNPQVPMPVLQQLAHDSDKDVRLAVAAHDGLDEATLRVLYGVDAGEHWSETPAIHLGLWLRQAQDNDVALEGAALAFLATGGDNAKCLVARHCNTTPELLAALAAHDNWVVRQAVAQNPNTDAGLLATLAEDSDYDVRQAVAAHAKTTPTTLARFALDSHAAVRLEVVQRPELPGSALAHMLGDDDEAVRLAAHQHPNMPQDRIAFFRAFENGANAAATVQRESWALLEEARGLGSAWAKRLLAAHPYSNTEDLCVLAEDDDWNIRQCVAQNPSANAVTLERLSQDQDMDVRRSVASNSALPALVLRTLLQDPDHQVRRNAALNAATSEAVRATYHQVLLLRMARGAGLSQVIALSALSDVRELGKHKHAQAANWLVRFAVAQNQATPQSTLVVLAQDGNRLVRNAARHNQAQHKPAQHKPAQKNLEQA